MKIIRYKYNEHIKYGVIDNADITEIEGDILKKYRITNKRLKLNEIQLLSPIIPGKIVALGYNYKDLVGERPSYDEPIIFFKPGTSIIGPNDKIILREKRKTWIEVELGIIIKKTCRNIRIKDAKDYILGYTIANDITMENVIGRDHHLARSKGWDTFCPIGPHIETEIDTSALSIESKINGKIMQQSNVNNRILNDAEILNFVSEKITLNPGDLIITGTPANAENSIIKDGDTVELSIENIGTLKNYVKYNGNIE